MSLIPLLFSDWWEDLDRPHRLLDQDFGLGLRPQQLITPRSRLESYLQPRSRRYPITNYIRPWGELLRADRGVSTVDADKDKFQVTLDVQQFTPEEIEVKVVDRHVIVHAKHEEKQDVHGWISREFTRKYLIPEQCDIAEVTSKLSSDGVLTIAAPRKDQPQTNNGKIIKIEQTGQPAVTPKEDDAQKADEKEEEIK